MVVPVLKKTVACEFANRGSETGWGKLPIHPVLPKDCRQAAATGMSKDPLFAGENERSPTRQRGCPHGPRLRFGLL